LDLNMSTGIQYSRSAQQQMEAVVLQAGGAPAQSLAYRSEPVPEPGPGEVLVEVHAAAVNPLDIANAAGLLGTPLPMIPGVDFAGIVVSDGDHAGQEVWGSGPNLGMKRPGTHARFVALPETWLSRKPERLAMTEAAAIGRSYLTIVADRRKPDGVEHFIDTSSSDIRQAVLDLTGAAVNTWPLENATEAYQTVHHGSAGIKQVLRPAAWTGPCGCGPWVNRLDR